MYSYYIIINVIVMYYGCAIYSHHFVLANYVNFL